MIPVVTIDGPSGAGKGTLCRLLANETGFRLLDSGALYRLTALAGLNAGIDLNDERASALIASHLDIRFHVNQEDTRIFLAGVDVSTQIRQERIGMGASQVAVHGQVRQALLQKQRDFQAPPGLVADGRDMGTVVFPKAQLKIFLTASAAERAERRVNQLRNSAVVADYQQVLADIRARDEQDQSRASAPLKPADDALVLDSTTMSIDEVFRYVVQKIRLLDASATSARQGVRDKT